MILQIDNAFKGTVLGAGAAGVWDMAPHDPNISSFLIHKVN